MNLEEFRIKPAWGNYETSLLERGYVPFWDPLVQARVPTIVCCSCGKTPAYVGMTNGTTTLGFLACDPECGEWLWFLAPTASTRP